MGLDSAVVGAICIELSARFSGARVKGLEQVDQWDIVVKTDRGDIVISCHPGLRRLVAEHGRRGSVATHFAKTADEVLRDTAIAAISQKDLERIVQVVFEKTDVLEGKARYKLLAELMGGSGNILLLTSNDRVIACLRKTSRNSAGSDYRPPRQPSWIEPVEANKQQLIEAILEDPDVPVSDSIQKRVMGLGPSLSREATHRCGIDADRKVGDCSPEEIALLVQQLTKIHRDVVAGRFSPTLYYKAGHPYDVSCFTLSHLHGLAKKRLGSMNEALIEFYSSSAEVSGFEEKKKSLQELLAREIKSKNELLANQMKDLKEAERSDEFKAMGDAILTDLKSIKRGTSEVFLGDPRESGKKLKIVLLPGRSPQGTAQEYYKKYKKMKKALPSVRARIAISRSAVNHLEGLKRRLESSSSMAQLDRMTGVLTKHGLIDKTARKREREQRKYRMFLTAAGWEVIVGRNDRENDEITFHQAKPKDIFFHVGSAPGSHTIMKVQGTGRVPGKRDVEEVACIAAYYSKARTSRLVPVAYTERRYVRKPRKAPAGTVVIEREKTIMVEPLKPKTTSD
jgi:predicted ribosome quality control (RQC) complex YloA/Tae2 family protein